MGKGSILIIEDEWVLAQALSVGLSSEGFHVEVALDGKTGMDLFKTMEPALVLLDVNLPGIDGMEVCRRVHASSDIPVLMMSGGDELLGKSKAASVGADDFIAKPFEFRELALRIRGLIRQQDS